MGLDFTGSSLFMILVLFGLGLLCIIKGGDWFVDASTWIAEASGIPKFIIGATVVSFATTLPEMLVSVFAALEGNVDIAVGNAVGSVTANIGVIMCIALICMTCAMTRKQFGVKAGSAADRHRRAVRLHPRRRAVHRGERSDSGGVRRVHRREPVCRKA